MKLKPCPFCGENLLISLFPFGNPERDFYYPECQSCFCRLQPYPSEQEAAESWNTRHNEVPPVSEVPPLDNQRREVVA